MLIRLMLRQFLASLLILAHVQIVNIVAPSKMNLSTLVHQSPTPNFNDVCPKPVIWIDLVRLMFVLINPTYTETYMTLQNKPCIHTIAEKEAGA